MKNTFKSYWIRLLQSTTYAKYMDKKKSITILLMICIPSLLIGLVLYIFGVAYLKAEMIDNHEEQIINQVDYIDTQIRSLEVNLNYLSHERLFRRSLSETNFQENFEMAEQLSSTLFSMQNSNTLIEQVHLYIDSERPSVFNPQFHWTDQSIATEYQRYLNADESFFWEQNYISDREMIHKFPLVLVRNLDSYQALQGQSSISFVIELNQEAMLQMIDSLSLASDGFAFLVDQHTGMIISSSNSGTRFFNERLFQEENRKQSFVTDWDGQDYSVTSGSISRVNTEWTYLSVVPIYQITAPIERLSLILMVASLIGIFISYIIGNIALRSIYRPFSTFVDTLTTVDDQQSSTIERLKQNWTTMNEEKEVLEEEVAILNKKLIEHFMLQLVKGLLSTETETQLRERAQKYHLTVKNKQFYFMDIEVMSKKQKVTIEQALAEHLSSTYYIVPFNDCFIGVVLLVSEDEDLQRQVEMLYQSIQQNVLLEKVIIHLSHSVDQLSEISRAVESVYQRKYKKIQYDQSMVIWLTDPEQAKTDVPLDYPFSLEKDILQSIDYLNEERTIHLLDQFIQLLLEQDERSIQYGFVQLYGAIQSKILKDGLSPFQLFDGRNVMKEIMHIYSTTELKTLLIDTVIHPYIEAMASEDITKQEYIVREAVQYIHAHYMYDLSLEECADELEVSTYNLSRWFKQSMKINFSEYLTHHRLEKAKQLLAETDLKIGDIAEKVGYQNSYFNRTFKKQYAITPGQYRKKHQKVNCTHNES